MIDDFAKDYLHQDLRWVRQSMLGQIDDLSEYEIRRPMTTTGTNLLGLIKHLTMTETVYFGEIFDRAAPRGRIPGTTSQATATGTRCGPPSRSRAQTSSTATSAPGRTLTPPSTRCRSTRSGFVPVVAPAHGEAFQRHDSRPHRNQPARRPTLTSCASSCTKGTGSQGWPTRATGILTVH